MTIHKVAAVNRLERTIDVNLDPTSHPEDARKALLVGLPFGLSLKSWHQLILVWGDSKTEFSVSLKFVDV